MGDVRLENEMDFLFSPENPEKQQQGSKHAQGPSEVIESTPDIPVPHWESENEERRNANAIDPINEAPRIEKWFRINPNAPKSMIDHYTFQLNEGRCKRYDKMRKENPDEAVPFPKLEAKDLNAWFIQRRGGSNGNDDQIPYGSKSLKGGKKSNGSNDQKVDMLVRCQPCQRIFASMDAMRAHQKSKECINHFLTRKPSGDSSSKSNIDGSQKLKRKELKKQMKSKKNKRKSLDDDFEDLATSW